MPASKFTQELFEDICDIISTTERGLVNICKEKGLKANTFYGWISADANLLNIYARAKELQAEFMAEQIIVIADESSNDTIVTERGEIPNSEWINRSRLRVDARKWVAAKLYPKKYADRVDSNVTITDAPNIIAPGKKND